MNQSQVRDAFLKARVEVAEIVEDVMNEFLSDDQDILLAMVASEIPPEVRDLLDQETVQVLDEVRNGKRPPKTETGLPQRA